jgi:hypothetical protein
MNNFIFQFLFLIGISSIGSSSAMAWSNEGYFKYSKNCGQEVEHFNFSADDNTCSTSLPSVILTDLISIPSFAYLDFVKWLTDPRKPSESSTKSSTQLESLTTPTEKKQTQDEVPEERKLEKSRLSLLQLAVDDSVHFLNTGDTTPLLLATFQQVEQFFVISKLDVDRNEAYAEAVIVLNQKFLEHQLNLEVTQ